MIAIPAPRAPRDPLLAPGGADLHVDDMTATFAADVTLADANARLREVGQWLPIDGDPAAPLGALVLANSTGPLRLGYGAWRDLLLGAQFTNGRGELVTAGGRTVKNVAGYDLTKFLAGSHGCFGTPVTITVRTYRRPTAGVVARFAGTAAQNVARLAAMLPSGGRPTWATLAPSGELACGYLGDAASIDHYRRSVAALGPASLDDLDADAPDLGGRGDLWARQPTGTTFRAAVPPGRLADWAGRAASVDGVDWSADAAFGAVVGTASADADPIARAADAVGGWAVRHDVNGFPDGLPVPPNVRALLERVKAAFDPDGVLPDLPKVV